MGGLLGVGAIVALSCLDEKVDETTESQLDRSLSGSWTLATGDIEDCAAKLMKAAQEAGSDDDISLIVIEVAN